MIDLHYPPTTFVGKPVPKNAFYRHLEVNAKMKQHFVDDVVAIKCFISWRLPLSMWQMARRFTRLWSFLRS